MKKHNHKGVNIFGLTSRDETQKVGVLETGTLFYYSPRAINSFGGTHGDGEQLYMGGIVVNAVPDFLIDSITGGFSAAIDRAVKDYEHLLTFSRPEIYLGPIKEGFEEWEKLKRCTVYSGCAEWGYRKAILTREIPAKWQAYAQDFMKHFCDVNKMGRSAEENLYRLLVRDRARLNAAKSDCSRELGDENH